MKSKYRVSHQVIFSSTSFVKARLSNACAKEEANGMVLYSTVYISDLYFVAIFIGIENLLSNDVEEESQ